MRQPFYEEHWTDLAGNPAGGVSTGTGFTISWQNGPLTVDGERKDPNGGFVETLLEAVYGRIVFYEAAADGRFACDTNKEAMHHILSALDALDRRTKDRETRGVEGTHGV